MTTERPDPGKPEFLRRGDRRPATALDPVTTVKRAEVRVTYSDGTGVAFSLEADPPGDGMVGEMGLAVRRPYDDLAEWPGPLTGPLTLSECGYDTPTFTLKLTAPMRMTVAEMHPSPGADAITAERQRQKGMFSPAHDAAHPPGLFAREAACYARWAADVLEGRLDPTTPEGMAQPEDWPDGGCEWKPRNPLRALEKAGALAAAELDRAEAANPRAVSVIDPTPPPRIPISPAALRRLTAVLEPHAETIEEAVDRVYVDAGSDYTLFLDDLSSVVRAAAMAAAPSPDPLRAGLEAVVEQLTEQETAIVQDAHARGVPPTEFRTMDGGWVLAPLLCARANALAALAVLR